LLAPLPVKLKPAEVLLQLRDRDTGKPVQAHAGSVYWNAWRKRWVLIAPPGSKGTNLLLARAATPEQVSRIGNQAGGRVFLFLHTDDFWRDYDEMVARKVKFTRPPSEEAYGTVAVFEDLYGNQWDLLQRKDSKLR